MNPNDFKQADITKKLSEISEMMGDGYLFVKLRFSAEKWESEVDDSSSVELLKIISQFHKLCTVMKEDSNKVI